MKRGDRVLVLSSKYREVKPGATGEVRNNYNGTVAVVVDGACNTRSGYGCFYFLEKDLKVIDDKEVTDVLTGYINIVEAEYLDSPGKVYRFANYDPNVVIGSTCVVKSANHGLGIAQVTDTFGITDEKTCREVVAIVDMQPFLYRVEKRKASKKLLAKMAERSKELEKMLLYKTLAASDPAMAALVQEYEEINNADKDV